MQQVTSLDAQVLNAETPTAPGHVGALLILDPATTSSGAVTLELFRDLCQARLHQVPRLRQRLIDVPLHLGQPYWVDDPHFDLEYHVREIGLPAAGGEHQLAELVAGIHSRPLDRVRPLWEAYLVQGLARGRAAIYAKVHHVLIDPESGVELLAAILDDAAEPPEPEVPESEWRPASVPSQPGLLARGLTSTVGRLVTSPPRTVPHLSNLPGASRIPGSRVVSDIADTVVSLAVRRLRPRRAALEQSQLAPRTPLNGALTPHRSFGYGSVPLADIEPVATTYGQTVYDVGVAMAASALRRWLLDHDALPQRPLVAAVLTPAGGDEAPTATGIRTLFVQLPTHLTDPEQRLAEVAKSLADHVESSPATTPPVSDATIFAALWALTCRGQFRQATVAGPAFNLFVSLVPGPRSPVYIAGARVASVHPVSAVTDRTGGLNLGLFGYDGSLELGVVACRELVPDVANLIGYFADALGELAG